MKIKALALVMSLLLLCSCFVACNSGDTDTTDTEATETQAPETTDTQAPDDETPGGETPGGETPGGETPGGETPGGETPTQTPAEKYADLYAQGYVYYENEIIPAGSTDKYILDQDNFEKWYKLQLMAGNDLFGGFYILATDVTINEGNAADWKTTQPAKVYSPEANLWGFDGEFDGNGKTISGLCLIPNSAGDEYNMGLFGRLVGAASVKNLRFVNSYVESRATSIWATSGALASRIEGASVEVNNCYSDAIISGNLGPIGGFVGMVNAVETPSISNCVFAGKIESKGPMGGILAFANANAKCKITNCMNLGELVALENQVTVGGIMAFVYFSGNITELSNCVNLSGKVLNALSGYDRACAGLPVTNFVMITDIGVSNVVSAEFGLPTTNIVNKTFAEFLDSNNKVFADWTYEDGYIPNPTTHTKIPTSAVTTVPAN